MKRDNFVDFMSHEDVQLHLFNTPQFILCSFLFESFDFFFLFFFNPFVLIFYL